MPIPPPAPQTTPKLLGPFFALASVAPALARSLGPLAAHLVPMLSPAVRRNTRLNAARIFNHTLSRREHSAFTRDVITSFYQFITDVARAQHETRAQLLSRIAHVEGEAEYKSLRTCGRGAVLITGHMGSFEVGLGALTQVEPRIHVVFKRDASGPFETMRSAMHRTLGILEAPIDDGLPTWLALRDALLDNDVVVMQADRAIPGQRAEVVPFLNGHLRIPTGPLRLARMTGSPIVPVFTIRIAPDRFAVHLGPSIDPGIAAETPTPTESPDPALLAIASSIAAMVEKYPTQWLALHAAFEEDATSA